MGQWGWINKYLPALNIFYDKKDHNELNAFAVHVLEHVEAMVYVVDAEGLLVYVNPSVEKTTGFLRSDLIGRHFECLYYIDFIDEKSNPVFWKELKTKHVYHGEVGYRHQGGSSVHSWMSAVRYKDKQANENYYVFTGYVVENIESSQWVLYDNLTGLANRKLFDDRCAHAIKVAMSQGWLCAILYINLDRLSEVNDRKGHDVGDALIKVAAERLQVCLDADDTAARLWGDEFTILLYQVNHWSEIRSLAKRILSTLHAPVVIANETYRMTASMGISIAPNDSTSLDVLMKSAHLALLRVKSNGGAGYQFFTDDINDQNGRRMLVERDLEDALSRGEMTLFYQPKIDLEHQDIIGAEALIRWEHPEVGMLLPNEFISIAEESRLILHLGRWVLEQACRDIKRIREICPNGLDNVAVNLSALQFHDPNLIDSIESALSESGLPPSCLEIEITENVFMQDVEKAIAVMEKLKALGIRLSIDDFGIGYSSLSYLKRLPVDFVKIDQSFVQGIPYDESNMEIVSAVIAMAHKLNLKVVAEGVENHSQVVFLQCHYCDYAQGFLYSKPLPVDQFIHLIDHKSE